jgi:CRISPR/Cas system CSM-associated protein Csm3 (group 7 of RAMP superfamily)
MEKAKTIRYTIRFFSEWHCGSGLAAGADINALVIRDKNGLPFIPGKTMKGLVREAVEDILFLKGIKKDKVFYEAFGFNSENDEETKSVNTIDGLKNNGVGCCFFANAVLNEALSAEILKKDDEANNLVRFLYRSHSSTAINDDGDNDGIAKEHSLQRMETVIPCELHGSIREVPESIEENIKDGLKFIKRLGVNRNRGLGRCQIT